jgi:hypothetical protein
MFWSVVSVTWNFVKTRYCLERLTQSVSGEAKDMHACARTRAAYAVRLWRGQLAKDMPANASGTLEAIAARHPTKAAPAHLNSHLPCKPSRSTPACCVLPIVGISPRAKPSSQAVDGECRRHSKRANAGVIVLSVAIDLVKPHRHVQ